MARVRVEYATQARPQDCWALMADFANIDFFNPHLKESRLIAGSPDGGLGTERQCDLKDGRGYFRERVIDWQEGRSYTVAIYAGTLPTEDAKTTLGLVPEPDGSIRLYMEISYRPRNGLFGVIADHLIIRRTLHRTFLGVLAGLAEKAVQRQRGTEPAF
jgi:hypothetical protein